MPSNIFLEHFQREVLPQLQSSKVVMVLVTESIDSKVCLEIGAAVLLDKPIIVLTTSPTLSSATLTRIAAEVVVFDSLDMSSEGDKMKFRSLLKRLAGKDRTTKG